MQKDKQKFYWTKKRKQELNRWKLLTLSFLSAVTSIGFWGTHTEKTLDALAQSAMDVKVVFAREVEPVEDMETLIRRIAKEENFEFEEYLVRLAWFESRLNPMARNNNRDGSVDIGLFQWNMKYHPEISLECAISPECSTREAIKAISAGHQSWWVADKTAKNRAIPMK